MVHLARRRNDRQWGADRKGLPGFGKQFRDRAILEDLDFNGPLLCLDHRYDIAMRYGIARFHKPFDERSRLHVRAERGHVEHSHQSFPKAAFAAATIAGTCGRAASSKCLG